MRTRESSVVLTYVFDWILTLIFLVVFLIIQYLPVNPVIRDFNVNDLSISHPMRQETISTPVLVVLSFVVPVAVIILIMGISLLRVSSSIQRKYIAFDFQVAFLGLLQSWVIASLIVNFVKVVVGELRPDFLARCKPNDQGVCTGNESDILEGRKSFPSLHAAMASAGLVYLSFYIAGKLRPYSNGDGLLWRLFVTLISTVLALYIGLTRIADNQHHPVDVLWGFLIGVSFAYGAYRLHYPAHHDTNAGIPLYATKYKSEDIEEEKYVC